LIFHFQSGWEVFDEHSLDRQKRRKTILGDEWGILAFLRVEVGQQFV